MIGGAFGGDQSEYRRLSRGAFRLNDSQDAGDLASKFIELQKNLLFPAKPH